MNDAVSTKAVVTVSEMARMVGLSRARFYQLQGTAFPLPVYDIVTRRPIYTEEQQRVCLEVRRRNCGIDGRPVLFYARRPGTPSTPRTPKRATASPKQPPHAGLIDALKALGLSSVTPAQVAAALSELFPSGTTGVEQGEIVRAIFLNMKRRHNAGKVRS